MYNNTRSDNMIKYIIGIIVIIIVVAFIIIFNKLVQNKNKVKEAFSTMDVYLKKRWDLIPNLVEVTKKYASHEKEVFEKLTEIRSKSYDDLSSTEKISSNIELSSNLSRLLAIAENYPELKASTNFIDLSRNLSQVEDEIAKSRKYYNGTVRDFNNIIEMFPTNIVALICGFKSQKMFEAKEEEKESIKVEV